MSWASAVNASGEPSRGMEPSLTTAVVALVVRVLFLGGLLVAATLFGPPPTPDGWRETDGRVSAVESPGPSRRSGVLIEVSYEAGGETRAFRPQPRFTDRFLRWVEVGDEVRVAYDPERPAEARMLSEVGFPIGLFLRAGALVTGLITVIRLPILFRALRGDAGPEVASGSGT